MNRLLIKGDWVIKGNLISFLVINKRVIIGLIPVLVLYESPIKLLNLLNQNVVLNCILIPQGITSCFRRVINQMYKRNTVFINSTITTST